MIKLLTDKELLGRISDEDCATAIRMAKEGPVRRYPHFILAELKGIPTRIAKRKLRRYKNAGN